MTGEPVPGASGSTAVAERTAQTPSLPSAPERPRDQSDKQGEMEKRIAEQASQMAKEAVEQTSEKSKIKDVVRQEFIIGHLIQSGKVDGAEWNKAQLDIRGKPPGDRLEARRAAVHTIWEKQARSILVDSKDIVQDKVHVIENITRFLNGDVDAANLAYAIYEKLLREQGIAEDDTSEDAVNARVRALTITNLSLFLDGDIEGARSIYDDVYQVILSEKIRNHQMASVDELTAKDKLVAMTQALTAWTPAQNQALIIELKRFIFENEEDFRDRYGGEEKDSNKPEVFEMICKRALERSIRIENGEIKARTKESIQGGEANLIMQRGDIGKVVDADPGKLKLESIKRGQAYLENEKLEDEKVKQGYEMLEVISAELVELQHNRDLIILPDAEFNAKLKFAQEVVEAEKKALAAVDPTNVEERKAAQANLERAVDELKWIELAQQWRDEPGHKVNASDSPEVQKQKRTELIDTEIVKKEKAYGKAWETLELLIKNSTEISDSKKSDMLVYLASIQEINPKVGQNRLIHSKKIQQMAVEEQKKSKDPLAWFKKKKKVVFDFLQMFATIFGGLAVGNMEDLIIPKGQA